MAARPSIVIVDDAAELRLLVRTRLRLSDRVDVVGEGGDGEAAIALAEQYRPALMLLDVSMPGMDGLEALPRVREVSPATRVVMYSGFVEEGLAERTAALGAAAFFEKSTSLDTLAEDLLAVLEDPPADGADEAGRGRQPGQGAEGRPDAAAALEPLLQEHLERFREVFEDAAIGMATMTLSGRLVRANRQLGQLVGRSPEDLLGVPYRDLTGDGAARVHDALDALVRGGEDVADVEHTLAEGDPDRRLLATLTPVRDARNRPLYLFLQVQDVSRQRSAEEELRQTEARFRMLVDAVQDYAIFMLDPDGHVASWNSGAQRSKGYAASEIIGQHFRVFYPPDKRSERHPEHELDLALRDGRYEEEGWRLRKDGTRFWATVTITAVHDQDGKHVGFAKVTRDNTERRALLQRQSASAAALEAANEQLSRAADEQARFLAITAHELRSPVGVLAMTAETLARHWRELGDEERTEFFDGMRSSAGQLRRLLADLLMASRLQSSAVDLTLVPLVLRDELETIAARARRSFPDAEIEVVAPPDVRVTADPGRLGQVFDNLLANAVRHGVPPVRMEVVAGEDDVEILVVDAGAGVAVEMQGRLFDRFATGSNVGTGLGLFIVRELARAQGGDASYRPDDRAFVIRLPRLREERPPDARDPAEAATERTTR